MSIGHKEVMVRSSDLQLQESQWPVKVLVSFIFLNESW